MSRDHRLIDYLHHIAEAAEKIASYVEGLEQSDFLGDERTQHAVVFNLIIIGEAASKLLQSHAAFLDGHPDVPWNGMKGMRNRIAHGYFEIDLDVVWETARTAVPELLAHLPAIIALAEAE